MFIHLPKADALNQQPDLRHMSLNNATHLVLSSTTLVVSGHRIEPPSASADIINKDVGSKASCAFIRANNGGAGRDRTDDLKLAKLPLSQLSYGPLFVIDQTLKAWWAWEDLNFRPHAYQARALTN